MLFALPGAMGPQDLCAWSRGARTAVFGVSAGEARIPLAVLHVNPTLRASTRLKYPAQVANRLASHLPGFLVLDRHSAPRKTHTDWVERAIVEAGTPVDVLADATHGGSGTSLRIFAEDPERVLRRVRRIARAARP
jgi:predicted fused transcriptional regulator/phosphomethylpyrimidine kinase